MDDQRNSLLAWPSYYCQGKNMEELTQSLLLTTSLELETTRLRAQEEVRMRDDQLNQLKHLLNKTIAERDEAQNKCQTLLLEKLLLQQQQQQTAPHSGISSIEDEPRRGLDIDSNNAFSSSDCEESIVSSPVTHETPIPPPPSQVQEQDSIFLGVSLSVSDRAPLPENGKFLEAVMKAGPLLQNLLLAGPLPQWRHPPPPLDTYQIPPPPPILIPSTLLHQRDSLVSIDNFHGNFSRKRGFVGVCERSSDSSTETKYQRVV